MKQKMYSVLAWGLWLVLAAWQSVKCLLGQHVWPDHFYVNHGRYYTYCERCGRELEKQGG